MKRIAIASALLALSACASYDKKLDTWIGSPISALVSSWGPPASSFTLPDGSQVIEYSRSGSMQVGGYSYMTPQTTQHNGTINTYGNNGYANSNYTGTSTTYVEQKTPTTNINLNCKTRFTVSRQGVITNWAWEGNNC